MATDRARTAPTEVPVGAFLATVGEARRAEAEVVIEVMRGVSGHEPVMWGPSIIGFDRYHYRGASGRGGQAGALAFSPRAGALTIYVVEGFEGHRDALARLGRHTTAVSCLYVKHLSDIDLDVLREILERSYRTVKDELDTGV